MADPFRGGEIKKQLPVSESLESEGQALREGREDIKAGKQKELARRASGTPLDKELVKAIQDDLAKLRLGAGEVSSLQSLHTTDFEANPPSGDSRGEHAEAYAAMNEDLGSQFENLKPHMPKEMVGKCEKQYEDFKTKYGEALERMSNKDGFGYRKTMFGKKGRNRGEENMKKCINEFEEVINGMKQVKHTQESTQKKRQQIEELKPHQRTEIKRVLDGLKEMGKGKGSDNTEIEYYRAIKKILDIPQDKQKLREAALEDISIKYDILKAIRSSDEASGMSTLTIHQKVDELKPHQRAEIKRVLDGLKEMGKDSKIVDSEKLAYYRIIKRFFDIPQGQQDQQEAALGALRIKYDMAARKYPDKASRITTEPSTGKGEGVETLEDVLKSHLDTNISSDTESSRRILDSLLARRGSGTTTENVINVIADRTLSIITDRYNEAKAVGNNSLLEDLGLQSDRLRNLKDRVLKALNTHGDNPANEADRDRIYGGITRMITMARTWNIRKPSKMLEVSDSGTTRSVSQETVTRAKRSASQETVTRAKRSESQETVTRARKSSDGTSEEAAGASDSTFREVNW